MRPGIDFTGVSIIFFCHDTNGHYLLAKRSQNCRDEHGRWDPGGGALDFGEPVETVLKKEIKEEYSTDVLAYEFLGYGDIHRKLNGHKTHWIALYFKVLIDRKMVKNGEPHKFDALQWFTLDKLPKPLHSQLPKALKQFEGRL